MVDKVTVRFNVFVRGQMGGSFDMDRATYEALRSKWEGGSRRSHDETDFADEVLAESSLDWFRFLSVDEMEVEQFEEVAQP